MTERLSILLGFGLLAVFYCQFHLIQNYYFATVFVPLAWSEVKGSWHWFVGFTVVHHGLYRVLAIVGTLLFLWRAFAPVPKAIEVLWLMFRPYLSRELGYWKLGDRVERVMSPPGKCDLVVASDLHLETGRGTVQEGLRSGVIFPWLKQVIEISRAKGLLLLGDTTDTGDPNAWRLAARFFRKLGIERALVPGNHDIHFKRVAEHSRGLTWGGNWRTVFGPAKPLSHREFMIRLASSALPEFFPTFIRNLGATENSFRDSTVRARIDAVEGRRSSAPFPRLRSYGRVPVDVLLLDSNTRPSGWPVTNAIGFVGQAQLDAARTLLARRDTARVLLLALHHHIIPPMSLAAPLLVCCDYMKVLDLAAEFDAEAIVHGHTHMPYVCKLQHKSKSIRIISCGSPLFDATGPLAEMIRAPSCFGLTVEGGHLKDEVLVFRRAPNATATRKATIHASPKQKRSAGVH